MFKHQGMSWSNLQSMVWNAWCCFELKVITNRHLQCITPSCQPELSLLFYFSFLALNTVFSTIWTFPFVSSLFHFYMAMQQAVFLISLVFFVVNLPLHDWWSEVIWWGQCTAMVFLKETHCSPLFMVSLTLFCGISWKPYCLSCMVHHTNFSLVWGSLRLASIKAVVQS